MRRISPGTITVGVIAIMIGLVVAYVVRRSLDAPPQSDSPAGVAVVVATVNLAEGQVVQANFVEVARLPAERVPQGAIRIPAVATLQGLGVLPPEHPAMLPMVMIRPELRAIISGATSRQQRMLPSRLRSITLW